MRAWRWIPALGVTASLAAGRAAAQALPIDVTAVPTRVMPGGTVLIKGTTVRVDGDSRVTLRVSPPGGGGPAVRTATPATGGAWSLVFSETRTTGIYQVEAIAPDGKGRATASFTVELANALPGIVASRSEALVAEVQQAVDVVLAGLGSQPVSPARQEAEARLEVVRQEVAKAPAQLGVIRMEMDRVFGARAKVPEPIPLWDEYVESLAKWERDAAAAQERLDRMAQASAKAAKGCADLDQLYEILTAASDALKLAHAPVDLSLSFWKSKAIEGTVARTTDPRQVGKGEKFAYTQALKLGVAAMQGPAGLLHALPGLMLDTAKLLHQKFFAKFCQKLEGPLQASFLGESFTTNGDPFFKYRIALDGKVVLMYPTGAPANAPLSVVGYVEGNGQFEIEDTPETVGRLIPGMVLYHTVKAPPGIGYWNDFGQGLKGLFPNYFRVPLRGVMTQDSIVVTLEPATTDFGESIKGRSIWVVLPAGGLVPQILDSPIAFQKAQPILERAIRRDPVLRIRVDGDFRIAEGTWQRDTTNAEKTARVRTVASLRACTPQCLPAGLYKGVPQ